MNKFQRWSKFALLVPVALIIGIMAGACGGDEDILTVYSGRSRNLVHPILEAFRDQTGIAIRVNYAGTSQIASTILEEGDSSPADVVFLQDPGFLGLLSDEGILDTLPDDILNKVDRRFRAQSGDWIGTSGRARTVVYNTSRIDPDVDIPDSILDFTAPEWRGRVGWAPQNASFQAFVTGMRVLLGEDRTREWLEGIQANDVRAYPNNVTTVQAAARGEIDVGFVNHYYLRRFLEAEGEGFGARNHYLGNRDPGALVLTAGVGILKTADSRDLAEEFIEFLLSKPAQEYFANETQEYPLVPGFNPRDDLVPLEQLDPPDINLSELSDAAGTLDLLRSTGILP